MSRHRHHATDAADTSATEGSFKSTSRSWDRHLQSQSQPQPSDSSVSKGLTLMGWFLLDAIGTMQYL